MWLNVHDMRPWLKWPQVSAQVSQLSTRGGRTAPGRCKSMHSRVNPVPAMSVVSRDAIALRLRKCGSLTMPQLVEGQCAEHRPKHGPLSPSSLLKDSRTFP